MSILEVILIIIASLILLIYLSLSIYRIKHPKKISKEEEKEDE